MYTTIISEKPSQALAYSEAFRKVERKDGYFVAQDSRFFNGEVFITWGFGHLVSLVGPEIYKEEWGKWSLKTLPMIPENFQFSFGVPNDKKKQFNVVKSLLQKADEIVVATDADREGENIARSIIEKAGQSNKPIKRLWINSLEVDEIEKGLKNLREGNDFINIYHEAQTRQFSDWMVGMNASRLYTLLLQQKGVQDRFSVGRVQTPSLYLIYKRQQEIAQFRSVPFFELLAKVEVENGSFIAKYKQRFETLNQAQELLFQKEIKTENEPGKILSVEKQLKSVKSPKLHSLSSLQGKANKLWKYSPAAVLKIAQGLYEKKLLSYPRTDTHFITEGEFLYIKDRIESYKESLGLTFDIEYPEARKRFVDGSKVQEHYGLIPTKNVAVLKELSEEEQNIYREVVSTTLAMFAGDYEYEETKVEVDINGLIFGKTGKVEKKKGWEELFSFAKELIGSEEDKKEPESHLPVVKEGEETNTVINVKEGTTSPSKHYTEGQLILMMKTAGKDLQDEEYQSVLKDTEGIGTEATRASIIETLKAHNYIEVKKNIVSVTKKGEILCEAVKGTLLASPEMTAKWEQALKKIGHAEGDQLTFLQNIEKFLVTLLDSAPNQIKSLEGEIQKVTEADSLGTCPSCQKGTIADKGKFYGCSEYRNGCSFTLPQKMAGKKISKTNIEKLVVGKKTTLIKGFTSSKTGKLYDAYLNLKEGKITFEFPQKSKVK